MHFLGIDIGGTKIKYVILDEENTILEKNQILTEDNSSELPLWKDRILDLIKEKIKVHSNNIICGI
ncbi:MAG: hypothetical protein WBN25_07140 [Eudoraea sp.]